MQALATVLQITSWEEHLPEEDMPPREIWHHQQELKAWFDELKAKRKRQASGSGNDQQWETVPDSTTVEVDIAEELAALRAP